ncbi:hypothetical protein R3P38DRAFT_2364054, partial [Favolaschia claudopus]
INGGKAASSCTEAYSFLVSAASRSSTSKSCTNAPVHCALCNGVHWKYNMPRHLIDKHPKWELTAKQEIVNSFTAKFSVSDEEYTGLRI